MQPLALFARPRLALAVALLFLTVPAWAVADSPLERVTLKGLDSVDVLVEKMNSDAERDGLPRSQIKTDVELRLRQSRIKINSAPLAPAVLYVNVNTVRSDSGIYAVNIAVAIEQPVRLLRDPKIVQELATTWSVGWVGITDATRLGGVRSVVTDLVDQFINAYLEQNPKP